jgi:hypothetical protein
VTCTTPNIKIFINIEIGISSIATIPFPVIKTFIMYPIGVHQMLLPIFGGYFTVVIVMLDHIDSKLILLLSEQSAAPFIYFFILKTFTFLKISKLKISYKSAK